jgi:hypothetical protein
VSSKPEAKKVIEYGTVDLTKQHEALDRLASEVQSNPDSKGYILAYGGASATAAQINAAAKKAKDYLVNQDHIEASKIIVVNGGNKKETLVVLWLVPAGATPPQP